MPHRRVALATVTAAAVLASLGACSGDDDEAQDPTTVSADPTAPTSGTTAGATWPDFEPTDYTYRLRALCYCPQTGPVEVTVSDGEVTSAVTVSGPAQGEDAPEFARLSINDVIAAANEAEAGSGSAQVTWPDDSAHPTSVAIDRIEGAIDDEVTYTIRDVVVP